MGGTSSSSSGSGGAGGMGGTSSSSSGSGGGGQGGAGGGLAKVCPDVINTPKMVAVPSPNGIPYCIDSTEVTNKHYAAWLMQTPAPDIFDQKPECIWNQSFDPVGGIGPEDLPVVGVDWCDAVAFCKAQGKRLCGRIGGGSTPFSNGSANADISQWYNACSKGGTRTHPYGSTYNADLCNGENQIKAITPVGTLPECQGGYDGIFDLSGNAWEWEDACEAVNGEADLCRRRGGSFTSVPGDLDCSTASTMTPRNATSSNAGFRCCAD
ncbi:formylglycine-generating enzyme family protein [Polyangium aurulentum]|uniref:formylglycine-generating enzyme family protein n=1 Tax=Polyangium aurulentum TaxID=2567896 RepID=UPI0010AED5AA|nr:SUMF1/EgtB/PvdO family nonheme iron enzyme [Polyangium aurulentum]UQA61760.1 SUMF1/EgtB/PvdO family nonheme iron enzyme [Polyangium aurulentum]